MGRVSGRGARQGTEKRDGDTMRARGTEGVTRAYNAGLRSYDWSSAGFSKRNEPPIAAAERIGGRVLE